MPSKKGNILASDDVNMIQELIPDIEKKSINPAIMFIHDSNCDIFQPPFPATLSLIFRFELYELVQVSPGNLLEQLGGIGHAQPGEFAGLLRLGLWLCRGGFGTLLQLCKPSAARGRIYASGHQVYLHLADHLLLGQIHAEEYDGAGVNILRYEAGSFLH
jgi:hypothetical protein